MSRSSLPNFSELAQTVNVTIMYILSIFFTLVHLSTFARANTEIMNFVAAESPFLDTPQTLEWRVLSHAESSIYLNITSAQNISQFEQPECTGFESLRLTDEGRSCPHELWVLLDTEAPQWKGYTKFTFRASWPAHQPTDVLMDIFDPVALSNIVSREFASTTTTTTTTTTTRNKYARLRFIHTGVLSPTHTLLQNDSTRYRVSVHLILEPLLLGVLPKSVLPVVISILVILMCGLPISRRIADYLQKLASQANTELDTEREKQS